MQRYRGSGSPCDLSRATLRALAGLRLGSHRGCYRVGLGIAPSLWAAQASPSLLGGVVGRRVQMNLGDASSELQTALVPAPARSTSGLPLGSCESGEGRRRLQAARPALVPRGRPSSPPLPRPPLRRGLRLGCFGHRTASARQRRPAEPGERVRSAECRHPSHCTTPTNGTLRLLSAPSPSSWR